MKKKKKKTQMQNSGCSPSGRFYKKRASYYFIK